MKIGVLIGFSFDGASLRQDAANNLSPWLIGKRTVILLLLPAIILTVAILSEGTGFCGTLNVTVTGTGTGHVTSSPSGINCPGTCSLTNNSLLGQEYTLTATPDVSSTFAGWSGDDNCSGTSTCSVTIGLLSGNKTSTATFNIKTFTVTADANGNGGGSIASNVGGTSYNYPATTTGTTSAINYGTNVVLTASAGTGSTVSWNDCAGAGGTASGNGTSTATCTFSSLTANKTVTATFTLDTYSLTVSKNGTGSGTVTSNPAGINCGSTCSASHDYNTSVTLTAAASAGSTFTGWSGEGCSGTGTCTVTMSQSRNVTATFTLATNVPAGTHYNYTVDLGGGVVATFSQITGPCNVSKTVSPASSMSPPVGWRFASNLYDISQSGGCSISPTIKVTIPYNESQVVGPETNLRLFHWASGWSDVTASVDTASNTVTGQVNSLSPFGAGYPYSGSYSTGANIYMIAILSLIAFIVGAFLLRRGRLLQKM